MRKLLIAGTACMALSACGGIPWFSGKGATDDAVAKLQPIEESVAVTRLWSVDVGDLDESLYLRLVPAVSAGRVFAADSKGRVGAYDAATGKQLWRVDLKETLTGATGSAGDLVLVGSMNGRALALDAESGVQRWAVQLSSEILSPPAGGGATVVARTIDGKVFGLGAGNGQKQWIYERSVPSLSLRGTGAPLVYDDLAITGFASGRIVANDLGTGQVRWELSVGEARGRSEIERLVDVDVQPVVADGIMYVGAYQGNVMAVAVSTGRTQWSRKLSTLAEVGVGAENLFVTEAGGSILALSRATGGTVWTQDALKGRTLSGPVVIGDRVVVADKAGYLHVLAADSGRLVGRERIGSGVHGSHPVADAERLYILEPGGDLVAYTLR